MQKTSIKNRTKGQIFATSKENKNELQNIDSLLNDKLSCTTIRMFKYQAKTHAKKYFS